MRRRSRTPLLSTYTSDMGQLMSRRRAERSLSAAALESALASRAKSEFLANMSHELRTPLNAIIGFGDLIQQLKAEDFMVGKAREYADHVSRAGRHLLGIIGDILDISKIESGTFKLNLASLSLSEMIESSVSLVRTRIEDKKQVLQTRVAANMPKVIADELRLKQVLLNLLSNANKFTEEGGKIFIVATMSDPETATIAVSDTGRGMTPDEVECALKPFTQIQSTYTRNHEGTGLGLPIARALVEKHADVFTSAVNRRSGRRWRSRSRRSRRRVTSRDR
jgi:two-component system cell cycle sensor histidine kinase PleC